jgi:hypothetical protein
VAPLQLPPRTAELRKTENVASGVRIGVKPGQYGWTFGELVASWGIAEEVGFDVLACFDHVSSSPEGRQSWDAPSLLIAMAGRTQHIGLAVHVLNASLRHPFLLAGQLAVAQAHSGGRVEVEEKLRRLGARGTQEQSIRPWASREWMVPVAHSRGLADAWSR